ncbi:MAG: chaperone modulator CbpM [Bacteroidales bacterium]|nr:chaperone modulator CbpM [Bacteroidales bacterium]
MGTDLIIITEYCQKSHTDPSFVVLLGKEGLIDIRVIDGTEYILASQLRDLEKYARLYYDLSINIEGIDAIRHLLGRMENMQCEINHLKNRLNIYQAQIGEIE